MTSNEAVSHSAVWIAAGVQYAVLSRTMPALRHDLAGNVSVLRMGLAVISRKLENSGEQIECDAMVQRTQALQTGVDALNNGLRRLRHWDKPTDEVLDARDLLAEVCELARPFLALRNIDSAPLPDAEDARWPPHPVQPQPLMYLVLASIYHLAEGLGSMPARIVVTPSADRVHVACEGQAPSAELPEHLIPRGRINTPPIDRPSLQCLADHLLGHIEFESEHSVLIHLD